MGTKKEIGMDMVTGLMDKSYSLSFVDYRESFDNCLETIGKCLEDKNHEALLEYVDNWHSQKEATVDMIMENLKKMLACNMGNNEWEAEKFFEENEEGIRRHIYERDDSHPLKDLLRNTSKIPVRIELVSNHDCINSHWLESSGGYHYEESYFGDMVDALNLNPQKVKKILLGNGGKVYGLFPDKPTRNGKEHVSYEEFHEELENSCCGGNLLTYMAAIDVQEMFEARFNPSVIVIPAGNKCGLYSPMQGGGSLMGMELKGDVTLHLASGKYPFFRLVLDIGGIGYDYSIKQVYGVDNSFFGKTLSILS